MRAREAADQFMAQLVAAHPDWTTRDFQMEALLKLAEEAGETMGAALRFLDMTRLPGTHPELARELADVVITAYRVAQVLNVNLDAAITAKAENEELDGQDVMAAVAGYPRTGRDLADGYMLAALTIRATYDEEDPEIRRALRLYTGNLRRLERLTGALESLTGLMVEEASARATRERLAGVRLADAAMTQLLPPLLTDEPMSARVPGEQTQEIRVPVGPPPHEYVAPWSGVGDCEWLWVVDRDAAPQACGLPYPHPAHYRQGSDGAPLA